jgi:hypothetical protein
VTSTARSFPIKRLAIALAVSLLTATAAPAATITVNNLDGFGEGFNDTTPRAPEGGNPGTTLGALRLNAFQYAANQWGSILNGAVTIEVDGNFDALFCTPSSATLGQAGPESAHRDFIGAPGAGTWFAAATANMLAGGDLNPGVSDIGATFNSSIDAGCFSGLPNGWYYGFDHNPPSGSIDFLPTLLHEIGHGLGFLTFVDLASGAKLGGFDDIFMTFLEDHGTGTFYPAMTNGQRVSASINTGNLHWVGANVAAASFLLSAGAVGTHVRMYAPNPQEPGSSVSHYDTSLTPDELMEPFDTGTTFQGMTEAALKDMYWTFNLTPTPTPSLTATPTLSATPTPTMTPSATPPCPALPVAGCRTPAVSGNASLQYKDVATDDAKDQLQWKWSKGAVTTKAEFGSPLTTTFYQLCIYDGAPSLLFDATIPPGGLCGANLAPCWKDKPKGFDYKDKDLTPDGVAQLKLQEGLVAGKAQIQVKSKGGPIDDPTLPFTQPLTVQLHNAESGLCWEAVYSSPASKNVPGPPVGQFKDKAD